MSDGNKAAEYIAGELARCGVASINVPDGQMFFFSSELLAQLLIKSQGEGAEGRAGIFIQRPPTPMGERS